ncbi:hypothetical protein D3C72_2072800 [compost metagenome]
MYFAIPARALELGGMVDQPGLPATVGEEAIMARAIDSHRFVLAKDGLWPLGPVRRVHGILPRQLQQTEAIIVRPAAAGGIEEEESPPWA